MGVFCACGGDNTNGNTGKSVSALQLKRPSCYIFMATTANDGTKNTILESDFSNGVLPELFIQQKINHIDPSKRWYIVQDLRSVTNERADPERQSFDGGQNTVITAEGLRTVLATVVDANARYKKNLDRLACKYPLSFFEVDECGSLGGTENPKDSTIFEPHAIAKKTFYAKLMKAQGSDSQTLQISFEYSDVEDDADEDIIPSNSLGVDLCKEDSLLNLLVSYSGIANTAFTATLNLEYGGFPSIVQSGLLVADFKLLDTVTGLPVSLTSVTESPKGTYAFVSDAMTAGNAMQLQIADDGTKYIKEGFEVQTKTFDAVA